MNVDGFFKCGCCRVLQVWRSHRRRNATGGAGTLEKPPYLWGGGVMWALPHFALYTGIRICSRVKSLKNLVCSCVSAAPYISHCKVLTV